MESFEKMDLESRVLEAVRTVYDPEIPVNIYELGLIYELKIEDGGAVSVKMTLTAPNCPEAVSIPGRVEDAVKAVEGVTSAKVDLTFDPPWCTSMMSEAARLQLNMF